MLLAQARRRQLLSQRDLAKRAGVTASTIYLIENNKVIPRLYIIKKITKALGYDPLQIDEFKNSIENGGKHESRNRENVLAPQSRNMD